MAEIKDAPVAPVVEETAPVETSEETQEEIQEETPEEVQEEPAEEEAQEEVEEAAEAKPEATEVEKPPSRRESLRIQKLIENMKGQAPQTAPQISGLDFTKDLEADPEVIARLQADREAREQAQYNAGLQKAESIQFHTRLEIDAPRIEAKYPIFDPNNQANFDSVAANAVNQWYLATAGYNAKTGMVQNSNIRYSDFVEGIMELAEVLAGEKTAQTASTIARQAAQTGLRPGGTVAKGLNLNKEAQDMTDEELDAKLATVFRK